MKNRGEPRGKPSLMRVAFSAKWLAALAIAFAVAGVFIALAAWQWERSAQTRPAPEQYARKSLDAVLPLGQVIRPGEHVSSGKADQMVSVRGVYEPYQAVIGKRLQDGQDGYWVVSALRTAERSLLPVVRAWVRSVGEIPDPPSGRQEIVGRLIPSEMPELTPDSQEEQGEGPLLRSLSTAQLINLWLPYGNGDDTYIAAVASAAISAESNAVASQAVKAVSLTPQQKIPFNWLNVFYALEWAVFAGFVIFLWWRLVRDDYERRFAGLARSFVPDQENREVE